MNSTMRKSLFAVVLAIVMVFSIGAPTVATAATSAGYITSASNMSGGIKVSWKKDSKKSGYYIYRKFNSSTKWKKIKTIKGASTTTWTDTTAEQGKTYNYKVYSYKGTKAYSNTKTKTMYRLATPKITSVAKSGDNIRIQSNQNSIAGGYIIKYSKSSDFSNAKEIEVYGQKLDKVICNLSCSTKYYVKIRAFKTNKGVRYYSGFSPVKTFTTKAPYTMYTKKYETIVYSSATSSSTKTTIPYNAPVKMYQDVNVYPDGTWKKIKYNNKYYYIWLVKVSDKLTSTPNKYQYTNESNSVYQNEIVNKAVEVFNMDTEYAYKRADYSNGGINPSTGKYPFDCSGFVRYVYNNVMQQYNPSYVLPQKTMELYNMDDTAFCNKGFGGSEIKAKLVCSGKMDYTKLQPGDVLFFNMDGGNVAADHCAIYLGNKNFAHSVGTFNQVIITPTTEQKFIDGFKKAVRFLPSADQEILINQDCVATAYLSIHPDISCPGTDPDATSLPSGTEVKLISTCDSPIYSKSRGYIEYNYNGKTMHGFITDPATKLSALGK